MKTNKWIPITKSLPECNKTPNTFGVPVLIYPPFSDHGYSEVNQVYYGTRVTDEPNFYIFGRLVFPTHWMSIPEPPK